MIIVFLKEHFIQSDRKIQKQVAKLAERSKALDLRSGTCKNVRGFKSHTWQNNFIYLFSQCIYLVKWKFGLIQQNQFVWS